MLAIFRVCKLSARPFATFSKIFYLFIFRQRRREGEREGEKHQYVVVLSLIHI